MDAETQRTPKLEQQASRGTVRFGNRTSWSSLRTLTQTKSVLFVEVQACSAVPGALRELIEASFEDALVHRGATAPQSQGHQAFFSPMDQLQRAQSLGFQSVVVAFGSLGELACPSGTLHPADSAALCVWADATQTCSLTLLLEEQSRHLLGYDRPKPLYKLLQEATVEPPNATSSADIRKWADELHTTRGPKPLAQIERLFLQCYLPLVHAELSHQTDSFSQSVRGEWAAAFTKSYLEAFAALRVTGKRPTMVLDVPTLAARLARLHNARATHLLLVDSLRFDLGLLVHQRLRTMLQGKATCTEQCLLWSALPSTTATQLELLARGADALTDPSLMQNKDEETVTRGRCVNTLRRIKLGHRDLLKLDVVEARLRDQGPPVLERLAMLADEVASVVSKHAESLPPRTLLFIFGDHGFVLEDTPYGSGSSRQGNASPEEILVPGFAWITDEVQ